VNKESPPVNTSADRSSGLHTGPVGTSALTTFSSEDVTRHHQEHHGPSAPHSAAAHASTQSQDTAHPRGRTHKRVSFHERQFASVAGKGGGSEGAHPIREAGLVGGETDESNMKEDLKRINTVTVCGKNYLILGVLGKGASSVVYRVFDPRSSGIFAYKRVEVRSNGVTAHPAGEREMDDAAQGLFSSYMNEIALLQELRAVRTLCSWSTQTSTASAW